MIFMNTSQLIDALGGTAKVARLCEVEMAAVSQWRHDGIPNARLMFLKLARPEVFKMIEKKPKKNSPAAAAKESNEEIRREVDLSYRQPADPKKVAL